MYDEVRVSCPGCGGPILFQSKGGACQLRCYGLDAAPLDVLVDVVGGRNAERCPGCGKSVRIVVSFHARAEIPGEDPPRERTFGREDED